MGLITTATGPTRALGNLSPQEFAMNSGLETKAA
ncbi:hypothetical protein SAMN05444007_110120 [Cribrihabitans marinus]|uniref:Uncharacterized protein n=1 Tax=Cribrihabitans marinus TaxID=1227549 RepID=A0A1H7DD48_9RHOB|nr:hypothetical protein SAMN05444007_110120 [Cribrihabitans marinus]